MSKIVNPRRSMRQSPMRSGELAFAAKFEREYGIKEVRQTPVCRYELRLWETNAANASLPLRTGLYG